MSERQRQPAMLSEFVTRAEAVIDGRLEEARAIAWARWQACVPVPTVREVVNVAAGDPSPRGLVLTTLAWSAGVAACGVQERAVLAHVLAQRSRIAGQPIGARAAYADALESVVIASRFLGEGVQPGLEQAIEAGHRALGADGEPASRLLDARTADPSTEWLRLAAWSSEAGPHRADAADATVRLVLRFERWAETGGSIAGLARQMLVDLVRVPIVLRPQVSRAVQRAAELALEPRPRWESVRATTCATRSTYLSRLAAALGPGARSVTAAQVRTGT